MIWAQIFISVCTLAAFWLVSHRDVDVYLGGLCWSIIVEAMWVSMFIYTGQYGFLLVSVVMIGVVIYRIVEVLR